MRCEADMEERDRRTVAMAREKPAAINRQRSSSRRSATCAAPTATATEADTEAAAR